MADEVLCIKQFVFFCIMFLIPSASRGIEESIGISKEEDLELERQLKVLNKPPIRSFQNEDGTIIDCIDINKQPAFDHPLLRNHTIQLRPTSLPSGLVNANNSASFATSRRKVVNCPPKTVPIRRTTKEDLIRARTLTSLWHTNYHSNAVSIRGGHYFATVGTSINPSVQHYGASGYINIYNEAVLGNQYSGAGIWIGNSTGGQANGIHYGWTVNPTLFKDSRTRTVSFWTTNSPGNSGCFNVLCPGFVQVSGTHHVGEEILRQSVFGKEQFSIRAVVYKDPKTQNWWIVENMDVGGQVFIGYWPKALFTSLSNSASEVRFGGEVYSPPNQPAPPMGSGQFKPPDFQRTSYVSHIQFINSANRAYAPANMQINEILDPPSCYKVTYLGDTKDQRGYSMLFGGPFGQPCN